MGSDAHENLSRIHNCCIDNKEAADKMVSVANETPNTGETEMNWDIKYENDAKASIRVAGSRDKAERIAQKRNKYNETYTITEAKKENRDFEIELEREEARKYGVKCM